MYEIDAVSPMAPRHLTEDQVKRLIDRAVAEVTTRLTALIEQTAASCDRPMKIFGLDATAEYAGAVARELKTALSPHDEKYHEDGESYVKPDSDSSDGNVRGHNVFVVQSLYSDNRESISDKFVKLCIFCGALKDASAHQIIAVIPYLGWARQDRKTESRAPITTKYIAKMLEAAGVSRCLFFDVHNLAAEQNAFSIPIDNLETKNLIADWCANKLMEEGIAHKVKLLSPDSGGLGRTERFRNALLKRLNKLGAKLDDIQIVVYDKLRVDGQVKGSRIIGDVEGAEVIGYDDMISTAGTIVKATDAVIKAGGHVWAVAASHGLFCGKANDLLSKHPSTKIIIADTVQSFRLSEENRKRLHVIDTAPMVAAAIKRIHSGTGSLSELLRV
jgi:ribose-phosphate pyrophosphokinase